MPTRDSTVISARVPTSVRDAVDAAAKRTKRSRGDLIASFIEAGIRCDTETLTPTMATQTPTPTPSKRTLERDGTIVEYDEG